MKKRLITTHFEKLGAKLTNDQWSWGAPLDGGGLLLRVWWHEVVTINGRSCVAVLKPAVYPSSHGYGERIDHLEQIKQGERCYLVMCTADNPNADHKHIKDFSAYIFKAGRLIERDGNVYIERRDRMTVTEFKRLLKQKESA